MNVPEEDKAMAWTLLFVCINNQVIILSHNGIYKTFNYLIHFKYTKDNGQTIKERDGYWMLLVSTGETSRGCDFSRPTWKHCPGRHSW